MDKVVIQCSDCKLWQWADRIPSDPQNESVVLYVCPLCAEAREEAATPNTPAHHG